MTLTTQLVDNIDEAVDSEASITVHEDSGEETSNELLILLALVNHIVESDEEHYYL